jgi:two-component system cell cycle sensor histidine kinase/response regulator CckA
VSTILVVDDVAANRELLVTLLRYQGHRLFEAADGREALAAIQAEHPDLVITDVLMPVMDGYEFVRQLRLNPTTSRIPVVFYTAHYGEREARAFALSSGVSFVLTKPVEPEGVLKIVGRALAGETETGLPQDASPLRTAFDREHLRLLTDKLSEKAGDLKTANGRLRALINIGLELASERDADRLLQNVCIAARDLFGATYVTLGIVDRKDRALQYFVTDGTDAASWIKVGDSLPGVLRTVVAERRTLRGDNAGGDPAKLQLPLLHPQVHAFVAAPIASPAHVYGWICLVGNEGRTFTEDDEALVMALSGQVGRIYENGYFYRIAQDEAERAQRYLDAAEVILLALNLEGRITLVNRYGCSLLGWAAEDLLGRDFIETCVPARIRVETRQKLSQVHGGDDSIVENPIVTRSGDERLIEWRTSFLRDGAGHIVGTLSSGSDITERQRAEEEARKRGQLSALGAAVGLSLTEADSLGVALQRCAEALVTHLGAAFARIWTLNESETVLELQASAGLYTHLNGPHGRVPVGQFKIGRIARDRKPHLTNTVIGDPEVGDQEWARRENMVAFAGHPLIVEGRIVGVMALFARHALSEAVISALTSVADHIALGIERHRSAGALRSAEERMRFVLQNADVGIWDMDYTTGVLRWSETAEAHYGVQPGTFGGTFEAFVERIHPDDRQSVLDAVGKAMKVGSDFSVQNRSIWADGTVRWLSGAGRVLLGEHGEPVRAVGISLDITERHTLEEQFQQAQKMEAVGQLAGGVAHDFNNVLTAILGFTELMILGRSPDDPWRADLLEIKKAGDRAAGLTRQLLAFSRKQILQPKVLDINVLIAGMESMLKRLIFENVNLMMSLTAKIGLVKVDPTQLEQIVVNLVVNAADAMPRGGKLTIETANIMLDENYQQHHLPVTPGDYVMLAVSDTGVGMDEKTRRRIFEPFFTTKGVGKGTGLGLATVHGIVKQSGGDIWVYSEPDRGTTFKIYLPQVTAGVPRAIERSTDAGSVPRGSETILLVEDDDGVRLLARVTLERAGYRVLQAENPKAAMRVASECAEPIHLLLSDVVMPESEGPPLFDRLSKVQQGLRVLYMSGYADEAIVRQGVLLEGTPFLQKPFSPLALMQKVRDVLEAPPMPSRL